MATIDLLRYFRQSQRPTTEEEFYLKRLLQSGSVVLPTEFLYLQESDHELYKQLIATYATQEALGMFGQTMKETAENWEIEQNARKE